MHITPRFSIVTPTYNRRGPLLRAIRSVQAQTMSDYEHIVVDDGSNDGTDAMVRDLRDPRIRFERLVKNSGANVARNRGIEMARGQWISFLDSDDEFLPHRIEELHHRIAEHHTARLFISSFLSNKRGRSCKCANPDVYLSGPAFEHALMAYTVRIAGTSISARRDLLHRVGGFAPRLKRLQDRQLLLSLARVTGAHLLFDVDWVKHCSADSISEQPRGYVESVDAMLDLHPILATKYRDLVGYHIGRCIVKHLLRGNISIARAELRANDLSRHLRFPLSDLFRCYYHGKQTRRASCDFRSLGDPHAQVPGHQAVSVNPAPKPSFAK